MSVCIALIRGINVGTSNRIPMSDLRDLVAGLGHGDVRTLLNSGNVVFRSKRPSVARISAGIQSAIAAQCGFSASVMVLTAEHLNQIINENPLHRVAHDPSRRLVAFVADRQHLNPLRQMLDETWTPEALAITQRAAYVWCPVGLLESKLSQALTRMARTTVTMRNWATVLKFAAKEAT